MMKWILFGFLVLITSIDVCSAQYPAPRGQSAVPRRVDDPAQRMRDDLLRPVLDSWNKIPQSTLTCIDLHLRERGKSVQSLVSQHLPASVPEVAGLEGACENLNSVKNRGDRV
jgi:hypothetical protein